MARSDLSWRIGTIGFSYPEWRGAFYPSHLRPAEQLSWYASHFDSLELDTTFHALPTDDRVRAWAAQVDSGFRFIVKAPRMITHEDGLATKAELLRVFVNTVSAFGPKLAMVLLQFPATFDVSQMPALLRLLDAVPTPATLAVEVRQRAWFDTGAVQTLADRGIAVVAHDYLDRTQPLTGGPTIFVRLIGDHDRFPAKNKEEVDVDERLTWWVAQIERTAPKHATVWVTITNDYAGYSVATATRLKKILGLATSPRFEHSARTLFEDIHASVDRVRD